MPRVRKIRSVPGDAESMPVRRVRKAYEQVNDQLRELIVSGELSPGERLPNEAVLAREFGVSRATVRDAMTPEPASCRETDDVERAVSLMADRQVRRMPVVDESGRLSGIIAQADVATRVNRDQTTGKLVEAISEQSRP